MKPMKPMDPPDATWYPSGLSDPSSSGSQNGWRYAFFPNQHRLAIEQNGTVKQYDTANHRITGVSQQQGSGSGSPSFTSQDGVVDLESLNLVG